MFMNLWLLITLSCLMAAGQTLAQQVVPRDFSNSDITQVAILGTGTPNPSPTQSGCSVAIVVNDTAYIVDFGPGVIRQATALSPTYGGNIKGLEVENINHAFLTHLHSDHTTGYPDLILTPWVMGRNQPLEVYGPEGINNMTSKLLEAYEADINYRVYGTQPANNLGWRVNSHEILKEGVVYKDDNVTVEAFPVPHGSWPNAWGYRFTTPDKIIVISGDTSPSEKLTEYARGADILIHEVYYKKAYDAKDAFWRNYHGKNHTSTFELAEIAKAAEPGLVVLYHLLFWGADEEDLLEEVSKGYQGKVIVARDLDVF